MKRGHRRSRLADGTSRQSASFLQHGRVEFVELSDNAAILQGRVAIRHGSNQEIVPAARLEPRYVELIIALAEFIAALNDFTIAVAALNQFIVV